jgi:hypothetical protein
MIHRGAAKRDSAAQGWIRQGLSGQGKAQLSESGLDQARPGVARAIRNAEDGVPSSPMRKASTAPNRILATMADHGQRADVERPRHRIKAN